MMMMMKSLICISLILIPLVSVVEGGRLGGGYGSQKPIKNLSDPNVIAIAKYAIGEHNKQSKENLVFVKVVEGTTQVVSGTKYNLKIAAKSGGGGKIQNYEAVVVEKLWLHSKSLESFKAV
ncbi:PREDICTED: cysteine proteinase inhibitor 4-like [Camelina sativa]|uniref:Cysteine proteinase inhibitor 4-like n=1 Tax=Camelina sativa TaxID=90675 RepID=A0ABM0UEW2_CAMSA|nr:PREDICTED: cysteine proteinase inhibitor 4-like [Camelina sativa]